MKEPSLWTAPTPQQGQKAAQDWEVREEKCSSSREGSHRTAQVRPSSSKPFRFVQIFEDKTPALRFGETKECSGPEEAQEGDTSDRIIS